MFQQGVEPEGPEKNPSGIGETQPTTVFTYGLSRESDQGHIGECFTHMPLFRKQWGITAISELVIETNPQASLYLPVMISLT